MFYFGYVLLFILTLILKLVKSVSKQNKFKNMSETDESQEAKITFKPKKRRNLRQKVKTDESEEEEETAEIRFSLTPSKTNPVHTVTKTVFTFSNKLLEMKELQNLRKRPHGVSIIGLALGTKVSSETEVSLKFFNFAAPLKTFFYNRRKIRLKLRQEVWSICKH